MATENGSTEESVTEKNYNWNACVVAGAEYPYLVRSIRTTNRKMWSDRTGRVVSGFTGHAKLTWRNPKLLADWEGIKAEQLPEAVKRIFEEKPMPPKSVAFEPEHPMYEQAVKIHRQAQPQDGLFKQKQIEQPIVTDSLAASVQRTDLAASAQMAEALSRVIPPLLEHGHHAEALELTQKLKWIAGSFSWKSRNSD